MSAAAASGQIPEVCPPGETLQIGVVKVTTGTTTKETTNYVDFLRDHSINPVKPLPAADHQLDELNGIIHEGDLYRLNGTFVRSDTGGLRLNLADGDNINTVHDDEFEFSDLLGQVGYSGDVYVIAPGLDAPERLCTCSTVENFRGAATNNPEND